MIVPYFDLCGDPVIMIRVTVIILKVSPGTVAFSLPQRKWATLSLNQVNGDEEGDDEHDDDEDDECHHPCHHL